MRPGNSPNESEVQKRYFQAVEKIKSIQSMTASFEKLIVSWKEKFKEGRIDSAYSTRMLSRIESKLQESLEIMSEAQRELEALNKEKELS